MDLNSVKQRLASFESKKGQKYEKIDYSKVFWRPKSGKHIIRIVPSKFDTNNPFKEVLFHYGFAKYPIVSLSNFGEKDPIVEFAAGLRKSKDKEDWELAKKVSPKTRIFAPVIVRGEEHMGVRLWEFGWTVYKQLLSIADDEDYGDYTDVNAGRDFTINATLDKVAGKDRIKCTINVKPKQTPLTEDAELLKKFLNEQPNIFDINRKRSFDEIKTALDNWLNAPADEEAGEEDSHEENQPEVTSPGTEYTPPPVEGKKTKSDRFDELFQEDKK